MVHLDDVDKLSDPMPTYLSAGSILLKKFDIPIQHLDFEYVNACKDADELEKILQILKSGEEGYYPQLTERTEQRLLEINPNSRHIRKTVKVLNREDIGKEKYEKISGDLNEWLYEINRKNEELEAVRGKVNKDVPEVRQHQQIKVEEKRKDTPKRIKSTDYAAWDKYDAETELLKMDLEDKKAKIEAEKLEKEPSKKTIVKFNTCLTSAEATFKAQTENDKGNEYFKAKEYENAIDHYNNSILYYHNLTAFRNRAFAYMALKQYENAITDYKTALRFDNNDFETLLRLGQCYQHLQKYNEAAAFAERAICINPNDNKVQKLAETIRKYSNKDLNETVSKVRMKVSNVVNEVERKKDTELKKSILKKEEKVIVPIPGTSKMPGPYYRVINRSELASKKPQGIIKTNNLKTQSKANKMVEFNLEKCNEEEKSQKKKVIENPRTNIVELKQLEDKIIDKSSNKNSSLNNDIIQELKRSVSPQQINGTFEKHQDLQAGGEPFTSITNRNDLTPEQIHMPYSFIQAWLSARKENNYTGFAKIIRSLDMHRLTEVIGNKLDATMLSEILNCLYRHFSVAHEVEKVYNLLANLCGIDRFNIIIMFLSNDDKTLLRNLINFLKQHGKDIPNDILRQYHLH